MVREAMPTAEEGSPGRKGRGIRPIHLAAIILAVAVVAGVIQIFRGCPPTPHGPPGRVWYDLRAIAVGDELYFRDHGRLPESLEELTASSPPYLEDRGGLLDPWKSPYAYEARDDRVIITSYGRDREAGTADDLTYESKPIGRSAGKE